MASVRTKSSWSNMKSRCTNPNYRNYRLWGGRGITYDQKWETIEGFVEDMGERPKGMSLDRIDNNKGYYKENCRWATKLEQANNCRNNRKIEYKGEVKNLAEWIRKLNLKSSTVRQRYYVYKWDVNKCFSK